MSVYNGKYEITINYNRIMYIEKYVIKPIIMLKIE